MRTQQKPPQIQWLGTIGTLLNLAGGHVPRQFILCAVLVIITSFSGHELLRIQRDYAQLNEETAITRSLELKLEALRNKINGNPAAQEQIGQEIAKLDIEANIAKAEGDALRQKIGSIPAAQAALEAEIAGMESEQRGLAFELKAKNQKVTGDIPLATAQKRAEISVAQGGVTKSLQALCLMTQLHARGPGLNFGAVGSPTRCPGVESGWTP